MKGAHALHLSARRSAVVGLVAFLGLLASTTSHAWDMLNPEAGLIPDYQAVTTNNRDIGAGSRNGVNSYRRMPVPVNPALFDAYAPRTAGQVVDVAQVHSSSTQMDIYGYPYLCRDINDAGSSEGSENRCGPYGNATFLTTRPAIDDTALMPITGSVAIPYAIENNNLWIVLMAIGMPLSRTRWPWQSAAR